MNAEHSVKVIKEKFSQSGSPRKIPLLRKSGKDHFVATFGSDGIIVDNLHKQPFLPWAVFEEAVSVMIHNGGHAIRGNAMGNKLGSTRLPLNSIEGHIAHVIYGQHLGESVFRRITPIACILIWAGVCKHARGQLILR